MLRGTSLIIAGVLALAGAAPSAQARGIEVRVAPPAVRVERAGRPPRAGQVWTPGYWSWNGRQHVWVRGRWQKSPGPRYQWQPAHWESRGGSWVFVEGRWDLQPGAHAFVGTPPATRVIPPPAAQPMPPVPLPPPPAPVQIPTASAYPGHLVQVAPGVARGTPVSLSAGQRAGYWLWVNAGGEWHLQTTTAGRQRTFSGTISPIGHGRIESAYATQPERNDRIRFRGGRVDFELQTAGGLDGLVMRTTPGTCLEVDLRLDRDAQVGRIFLGAASTPAPSSRFTVCP